MEVLCSLKKKQQRTLPFNVSLNKQFQNSIYRLKKEDESASMQAIHMLGEYIRYCLFEDYRFKNKDKLSKYCRLLLNYEACSKAMLVKCCKNRMFKFNSRITQPKSNTSNREFMSMFKRIKKFGDC